MPKLISIAPYFWSFLNTGGSQIISFLATMQIARLAVPSDFGLIAICSSIILICNLFSEIGLSSVVILDKEFSIEKSSTIFCILAILASIMFIVVVGMSDIIGEYIKEKRISYILPWMAFTILANGFSCVHNSVLIRELKFKKKAKISLVSVVVGSCLGLLTAHVYKPIFGLIVVYTLSPILITIGLMVFAPWGLRFYCKPKLIYSDLKFSCNIAFSNLLDQGCRVFLTLSLNERFGAHDLGLYSRAEAIKNLYSQTLDKVVQRVSFPVLIKKKHESSSNAILEHTKISLVLISLLIPAAYFFKSFPEQIIYILYGPNWNESASILKKLIYIGIFMPLVSLNLTLMKSVGLVHVMTFNKIIALLLIVVLFLVVDTLNVLNLLDSLIVYSIILYIISLISLLDLGARHLFHYLKWIISTSICSITIIFLHHFLLYIKILDPYLNIALNGVSLLILMIITYYGLIWLSVCYKNGLNLLLF